MKKLILVCMCILGSLGLAHTVEAPKQSDVSTGSVRVTPLESFPEIGVTEEGGTYLKDAGGNWFQITLEESTGSLLSFPQRKRAFPTQESQRQYNQYTKMRYESGAIKDEEHKRKLGQYLRTQGLLPYRHDISKEDAVFINAIQNYRKGGVRPKSANSELNVPLCKEVHTYTEYMRERGSIFPAHIGFSDRWNFRGKSLLPRRRLIRKGSPSSISADSDFYLQRVLRDNFGGATFSQLNNEEKMIAHATSCIRLWEEENHYNPGDAPHWSAMLAPTKEYCYAMACEKNMSKCYCDGALGRADRQ